MTGFHPVPKPPARPKKARLAWNSTLSAPSQKMRTRGRPRFKRGRCAPFLRWLRTERCFVTGLRNGEWAEWKGRRFRVTIDAAHLVDSRGRGAGDLGYALPLAAHLHRWLQHGINGGIQTFRQSFQLTPESVKRFADEYADRWRRLFPDLATKYSTEGLSE